MNQLPPNSTDSIFSNTQMDIDQLPRAEAIEFIPIDKKYAYVLYLSNAIFFGVLLIVLLIVLGSQIGLFHWITFGALLFWIVLLLVSLWFSSASVHHQRYAVRDKDISYQHGVFFRQWITIPFNRVQHCEITRGFIDNLFGLADLKVFTAGGSSSDISIPGLNPDTAHTLKELIINKIGHADEEE